MEKMGVHDVGVHEKTTTGLMREKTRPASYTCQDLRRSLWSWCCSCSFDWTDWTGSSDWTVSSDSSDRAVWSGRSDVSPSLRVMMSTKSSRLLFYHQIVSTQTSPGIPKAAYLTDNSRCFTVKFQQSFQLRLLHPAEKPFIYKLEIPLSIRCRPRVP